MARKPLTKPRKHASQERSRATVEALIEATARILVREGFDRASTNRIAELAGVSVGSLYQYFPGKEALVAAVIDRRNQNHEVVRGALAEVASQPIEKAVRRLVAVAIEAHRIDPKLHRVLAEQIPRMGRLENVGALNRETYALFRAYLEDHSHEFRMVDVGLAAFVCVTSIEALTHAAVLHRSENALG
jgi:AcrR family transcriptional regulator